MPVRERTSEAVSLDAEREAIRRALNDCMERQRIGVAALARLIAEKAGRSDGDISDKALLRFLAGRDRVDDEIVSLCHAFIEQTGRPDPVISFGDALCEFQQCDPDEDRLAFVRGEYDVTAHLPAVEDLPFRLRDSSTHYGVIVFEAVPGRPYLRAVEKTPSLVSGKRKQEAGRDTVFEGVALVQAHGVTAILRDVLTRRPKSYFLDLQAEAREGKFSGVVTSPAFNGRTGAGGVVLDVTLDERRKD